VGSTHLGWGKGFLVTLGIVAGTSTQERKKPIQDVVYSGNLAFFRDEHRMEALTKWYPPLMKRKRVVTLSPGR